MFVLFENLCEGVLAAPDDILGLLVGAILVRDGVVLGIVADLLLEHPSLNRELRITSSVVHLLDRPLKLCALLDAEGLRQLQHIQHVRPRFGDLRERDGLACVVGSATHHHERLLLLVQVHEPLLGEVRHDHVVQDLALADQVLQSLLGQVVVEHGLRPHDSGSELGLGEEGVAHSLAVQLVVRVDAGQRGLALHVVVNDLARQTVVQLPLELLLLLVEALDHLHQHGTGIAGGLDHFLHDERDELILALHLRVVGDAVHDVVAHHHPAGSVEQLRRHVEEGLGIVQLVHRRQRVPYHQLREYQRFGLTGLHASHHDHILQQT